MLLEIKNLVKTFPGVKALHRVNFQLQAGDIHALVGGHGAGKSTLIKALTGVYPKDSGSIKLTGVNFEPESVRDAEGEGINAVFHEVNLIPNLTVAENIFFERQPKRMGIINWKETNRQAVEALREFDLEIDVTKDLEQYSVAVQQIIVIARALQMKPRILILDEPTSSLNNQEAELLFNVLRNLREKGCSIIFISHYLDQVYKICDRVTLLEKGENVGTWRIDEISQEELAGKITKLADSIDPEYLSSGSVERLAAENNPEAYRIVLDSWKDMTLAGILESGRSEVLELEFLHTGKDGTKGKKISAECVCIRELALNLPALSEGDELTAKMSEVATGAVTVVEGMLQALSVKRGWFNMLEREEQLRYAETCLNLFKIPESEWAKQVAELYPELQQRIDLGQRLAAASEYLRLAGADRKIDLRGKRVGQQFIFVLGPGEAWLLLLPSEIVAIIDSPDCREFCYEV